MKRRAGFFILCAAVLCGAHAAWGEVFRVGEKSVEIPVPASYIKLSDDVLQSLKPSAIRLGEGLEMTFLGAYVPTATSGNGTQFVKDGLVIITVKPADSQGPSDKALFERLRDENHAVKGMAASFQESAGSFTLRICPPSKGVPKAGTMCMAYAFALIDDILFMALFTKEIALARDYDIFPETVNATMKAFGFISAPKSE